LSTPTAWLLLPPIRMTSFLLLLRLITTRKSARLNRPYPCRCLAFFRCFCSHISVIRNSFFLIFWLSFSLFSYQVLRLLPSLSSLIWFTRLSLQQLFFSVL
jgi:hypothetical protein